MEMTAAGSSEVPPASTKDDEASRAVTESPGHGLVRPPSTSPHSPPPPPPQAVQRHGQDRLPLPFRQSSPQASPRHSLDWLPSPTPQAVQYHSQVRLPWPSPHPSPQASPRHSLVWSHSPTPQAVQRHSLIRPPLPPPLPPPRRQPVPAPSTSLLQRLMRRMMRWVTRWMRQRLPPDLAPLLAPIPWRQRLAILIGFVRQNWLALLLMLYQPLFGTTAVAGAGLLSLGIIAFFTDWTTGRITNTASNLLKIAGPIAGGITFLMIFLVLLINNKVTRMALLSVASALNAIVFFLIRHSVGPTLVEAVNLFWATFFN